jgi:hypothetical protein
MYCPVCRTEYRPGFTRCANCNVDLVESLPEVESPAEYVVLWHGDETAAHDALLAALDDAGIGYADVPLHVYLRQSPDVLKLRNPSQLGFVICVRRSDLAAARSVLARLNSSEYSSEASSPQPEQFEAARLPLEEPALPLRWIPELATLEIWRGEVSGRAEFLRAALAENGIGSRTVMDTPEKLCLMIYPEDAERGREVIRQVLEAAVPETGPQADHAWYDEPVRSYLFAWLPALLYLALLFFVFFLERPDLSDRPTSFIDEIFAIVSFVNDIASLWMIYQAIRYELRPWRFVLLAFVPLSFIWYYYERYARRFGARKLPVAVRLRMSPPPA